MSLERIMQYGARHFFDYCQDTGYRWPFQFNVKLLICNKSTK